MFHIYIIYMYTVIDPSHPPGARVQVRHLASLGAFASAVSPTRLTVSRFRVSPRVKRVSPGEKEPKDLVANAETPPPCQGAKVLPQEPSKYIDLKLEVYGIQVYHENHMACLRS